MRAQHLFLALVVGSLLSIAFCVPRSALSARSPPLDASLHVQRARAEDQRADMITWYDGDMLEQPACGGATPVDADMIAAVPESWGKSWCGKKITLKKGSKTVTVLVVDFCATCGDGSHFDLSKGAFQILDTLDVGEIKDATWSSSGSADTKSASVQQKKKAKTYRHDSSNTKKMHHRRRRLDDNLHFHS